MDDDRIITRAEAALSAVLRDCGAAEPAKLLQRSQNLVFHLPRLASVARVRRLNGAGLDIVRREIAVAAHLAARGAPVVAPSGALPAGPHVSGGFAISFWPYVVHTAFNDEDERHRVLALAGLQTLHAALATYPGLLPGYPAMFEDCRRRLLDDHLLTGVPPSQRQTLLDLSGRIDPRLDEWNLRETPLHGDVQPGNILITADGALFIDFEAACRGPVEWDFCALTDAGHEVSAALRDLRRLCVCVWCLDARASAGKAGGGGTALRGAARRRLKRARDASRRGPGALGAHTSTGGRHGPGQRHQGTHGRHRRRRGACGHG